MPDQESKYLCKAHRTDNWVTVPTNSILTIHKQTVLIHPILDEFYNRNPSCSRSSVLAVSKGLVSDGPGAAVLASALDDETAATLLQDGDMAE